MKTISTPNTRRKAPRKQSATYIAEARAREQAWRDYRLDIGWIGAELWRLRRQKGYGIDYVAQALKMPKYRVAKIEHGMYIHFDVRDLHRLSNLYGTTVAEVLAVIPNGRFEDMDLLNDND
jgi:hypothetical protein